MGVGVGMCMRVCMRLCIFVSGCTCVHAFVCVCMYLRIYLMNIVDTTSVVEDTFCQRGFARVDMRRDTNISHTVTRCILMGSPLSIHATDD